MDLVIIKHQDNVAIMNLNRGVTNPINLDLVKAISENIQNLKDDNSTKSLILTSNNNKFFSIGFDLPELYELSIEEVKTFYSAFNRLCLDLYSFPKPTLAALTGHAIAGGCILTLCCDYRHISEGRKLMGLNEIKLGLPVPYPADCILRQLIGPRFAQELMELGEFYQPEESLSMGLVNKVLPPEQILTESIESAKTLGNMPQKAFTRIKQNRTEDVKEQILSRLDEKKGFFLSCWQDDEVRELLKEAIKKF